MNYSGFGSSDWMSPVGGFKPSRAGSEAFGDIGSKNAEMAAGFGESALSNMAAIKEAEIAAASAEKQAQALARAQMVSGAFGAASSLLPTKIKIV